MFPRGICETTYQDPYFNTVSAAHTLDGFSQLSVRFASIPVQGYKHILTWRDREGKDTNTSSHGGTGKERTHTDSHMEGQGRKGHTLILTWRDREGKDTH